MTLRLEADFNEVEDNLVWTSVRTNPSLVLRAPVEGAWAELYDEDGSSCWGELVENDWPILTFRLKWETWESVSSEFDIPEPNVFPGFRAKVTSPPEFKIAVG